MHKGLILIKLILFIYVFIAILDARENPFFNKNEKNMPFTSNKPIELPPLKNASLTLPSTAREIQTVKITYKNLDGTLSTKTLQLKNSIDWHLPLFVSQSYTQEPTIKTSNTVLKQIKTQYIKIDSLKFISFYANGKKLKIITKDKMIRNFLLVNPHRIVFDIKKSIDFRSHIKKMKNKSIFTKIRIGNHNAYYRVVVELDGYYSYKLKKNVNSYIFSLR